jgi:hypothetical protein
VIFEGLVDNLPNLLYDATRSERVYLSEPEGGSYVSQPDFLFGSRAAMLHICAGLARGYGLLVWSRPVPGEWLHPKDTALTWSRWEGVSNLSAECLAV